VAESPLRDSVAALSRFFVGASTVEETLTKVTQLTKQAIPAAELVGITMMVEGRQRTAVFTDEAAPEIDQAQYDSGEGPCLAAFEESRITTIADTHEPGEWPSFRTAAAEHGIRSTMSFPLLMEEGAIGAMNLYSRDVRAFDEDASKAGEVFAAHAAIVLANTKAYWDAHELSTRLMASTQSRAVIEQAKGILMAAEGADEDQAFDILVRASQRENVKLRDIARRIVDDAVTRGRQRSREGSSDGQ
jgi:GAF domain-containing protein